MRTVGQRIGLVLALALAATGLAGAAPAHAAAVINLPSQQPTIQAAIDAASVGDTVVVAAGTYFEHIDFKGKDIEVRSAAGPQATIIDGGGTSYVVVFKSGESRAAVLRGFTIAHGSVPRDGGLLYGGGIGILESSPTVTGNVVTANAANGSAGAGIGALGGSPLIHDNVIAGNHAGLNGGAGGIIVSNGTAEITMNSVEDNTAAVGAGIIAHGGAPLVKGNFIRGNRAGPGNGGGVSIEGPSAGRFVDNVILENTADSSGGGVWVDGESATPYLLNNTIAYNTGTAGGGIGILSGGPTLVNNIVTGASPQALVWCSAGLGQVPVFAFNDVFNGTPSRVQGCADPTGTDGNISADPQLNFPNGANYIPAAGSPVIDAGNNLAASLPATDVYGEGHPRVTDGDGDGTAVVDIGAVERPAVATVGVGYHPLAPARILDTRTGVGAPAAKLGPSSTLALQVIGRGGVPATGVSAVVLNVTVTGPTAAGWLTAWPAGQTRPVVSNLNYVAGQTVPNLVVVKVGDGGKVNLFNSLGSADVVADVAGWYGGVAGGARYTGVTPARILDTRTGLGAPAAKLGPGATLTLQVTGQGGVPATGVSAVVLNVTVTEPTAESWLTAWPMGAAQPLASNLNYAAGQIVPNLVTVKVGDGGRVNLFNSTGAAHVIADVAGWFGPEGAEGAAGYVAVVPERILDTRIALGAPVGPLGPASTLSLRVTGRGGVPASGVAAVVLNVTAVDPTAASWLTVWPAGATRPVASNLNYAAGQTVPNLVVVKVGDGGMASLYNAAGATHLIADVAGWYAG